jgi:hypothetical protein
MLKKLRFFSSCSAFATYNNKITLIRFILYLKTTDILTEGSLPFPSFAAPIFRTLHKPLSNVFVPSSAQQCTTKWLLSKPSNVLKCVIANKGLHQI